MIYYRTSEGMIADTGTVRRRLEWTFDKLLDFGGIPIKALCGPVEQLPPILPPIDSQEVWAAGVTYLRSKKARVEESHHAGGGDFYDRVYEADRPELFFKATPHRVVGHLQPIRIRSDSKWNVPEPELVLAVSREGKIIGYTIGNDVSSRDIEGANPLYLPQAKTYMGSCALGPGLWIPDGPFPDDLEIRMTIFREDKAVFEGVAATSQMRRRPKELVEWLFREQSFPNGVYLMTGTGIIPPDSFTLQSGDRVEIEIPPIGVLVNPVA